MESQLAFEAIGTSWVVDISVATLEHERKIEKLIKNRIELFDKTYSRFRADSLITGFSEKSGRYSLPEDAKALLDFYWFLYTVTEGKVTPLVGSLLSEAGYDANYSLTPSMLSPVLSWEEVFNYSGHELELYKPALLDFGAAGKGYLVDLVAEILQKEGITEFIVDAGGDMHIARAQEPVKIALEHPLDPTQAIGVAHIKEGSICGSASNRRRWQNFHHIMDPDSLSSTSGILATWVIAKTTMVADGLATALFFVPAEKLKEISFEYVLIREDLSLEYSPNFPGEIFTTTE